MKYNFGPMFADDTSQVFQIENVSQNGFHPVLYIGQIVQVRGGGRRKRVTSGFRSQVLEPQRQPASLKTCVTREKDPFPTPEFGFHVHTSQAAFPELHTS